MSIKNKSLFILLLTLSFLSAQSRIVVDLGGKQKVSVLGMSDKSDTGLGITFGYDHMLSDYTGIGFESQLNRSITQDGEDAGKFGFTSVYGVGKYDLGSGYGVARVGYSLLYNGDEEYSGDVDLKGGLMFGLGAGFKLSDNMSIEAGYYSNAGTGTVKEGGMTLEMETTYTRINASLVYSMK